MTVYAIASCSTVSLLPGILVYEDESHERAEQEPGADLRSAGRTGGGARA